MLELNTNAQKNVFVTPVAHSCEKNLVQLLQPLAQSLIVSPGTLAIRVGVQISSASVVLSRFFFNSCDLDPTQFHRIGSTST